MRRATGPAAASTPPAVRVHTLGTFAVEARGQPLHFGARGPRKPLALLKALIARGGCGVPVDALIESLWPDADGDRAHPSFRVALHRLRGLLGPESLLLSAGQLGLHPARCWVDKQACEAHLEATRAAVALGDAEAAWAETQHALRLYRGPFLAGEFDPPEVPAARERLHALLLRQLAALGELLLAAGEAERAASLYRQGLELDETAEALYQGLMRCYRERGQTAEALAVFERLREVREAQAGGSPSASSVALYQALRDAASGRAALPPATAAPGPPGPAGEVSAAVAELHRSARFPLPAQPSIVVLPFANLTGDPRQDLLALGLCEGLSADLSRLRNLFVIAPDSACAYRGQPADPRRVGRELGVRNVLTGSVQQAAARLRIAVQLVDAATGRQVWAGRYDRDAQDPFGVQDDIAWKVSTELEVNLTEGEQARGWRNRTRSLAAYGLYTQSLTHFQRFQHDENRRARDLLQQSLAIDPEFALALGQLGWTHWADARYGWSDSREEALAQAESLARDLMDMDKRLAMPHCLLSHVHLLREDYDTALMEIRLAIEIQPGNASAQALAGNVLLAVGCCEQAIPCLKAAIRLCPVYPAWYLSSLGEACRLTGRTWEALTAFRTVIDLEPKDTHLGRVRLTALLMDLGRVDEARTVAAEILALEPAFSADRYCTSRLYRDPAVTEGIRQSLLDAGLPA